MATTNHLKVVFDYSAIDRSFDIYQISTSEKYISKGAYVLDKPLTSLKALSVAFDYGRTAFVLFRKKQIDRNNLMEALGDEKLSFKKAESFELKDYILFRLFLYSLGNYQSESNVFNNLTGKLYLRISVNKKNIIALAVDVDKDMNLSANATTFSNLSFFSKDKEIQSGSTPKYVLEKNGKLRRALSIDKGEEAYVKKGIRNHKVEIPFLELRPDKIRQTRAYHMNAAITRLNERYGDYLKAEFEGMPILRTLGQRRDEDFAKRSLRIASGSKIVMHNLIDDLTYRDNFESTRESLEKAIGKEIPIASSSQKGAMNIYFLHDKDYYTEQNDPYKAIERGEVAQVITLEDSSSKIIDDKKAVINTILKELAIKNDIAHTHRISLDDWESFGFEGDWYFGTEKENSKYFMTIHPDGSFTFETESLLSPQFENPKIRLLSAKLDDSVLKGKSIVMDDSDNTVMMSRTGEYCLPSPTIYTMQSISRSKVARDELLSGIVDINLYERDGIQYYSSGLVGKGMNTGISKASLLYRVDVVHGNNILPEILETMSVMFVKYSSFTVLPYPFKYLREYIQMIEANHKTIK